MAQNYGLLSTAIWMLIRLCLRKPVWCYEWFLSRCRQGFVATWWREMLSNFRSYVRPLRPALHDLISAMLWRAVLRVMTAWAGRRCWARSLEWVRVERWMSPPAASAVSVGLLGGAVVRWRDAGSCSSAACGVGRGASGGAGGRDAQQLRGRPPDTLLRRHRKAAGTHHQIQIPPAWK